MRLQVFGARWCAPCRSMHAWLPELHHDGHVVQEIDVEECAAYAEAQGVTALPTIIVRDDGGREVRRITGATTLQKVRKALQEVGG